MSLRSCICIVALLSQAAWSLVHGQPPVTVDVIAKAWQARQERLPSVHIEWTDRKTIPKGHISALSNMQPRMEGDGPNTREVIPPEDTTLDLSASLFLDGAQARYTRDHAGWSAAEHKFRVRPAHTAFDGIAGRDLKTSANSGIPHGMVKDQNPIGHQVSLAPLVMTFRPMDENMRLFDIASFTATGRRTVIGGRSCLQLESHNGEHARDLWVDPGRDFLMVRYVRTLKGRTKVRIDVRYRQESNGEYVPESWESASYLLGDRLSQSIRGLGCRVRFNVPADPTRYQLQFPDGTVFADERGAGGKASWHQMDSGRARPMDLPGRSNSARGALWSPWLWLSLTAATGILLVWRFKFGRRSNGETVAK